MKDCILFGRLGNKQNDIKHFKIFLPMDCKNVIEPFGGTFAVTRIVYKDDKYNKYVNDNDEILFKIYQNPLEYAELSNKLNDYAKECLNEYGKVIFNKFMEKVNADKLIDESLLEYWKNEKIIRGQMVKYRKSSSFDKMIELMKKINFSCDNYLDIINKFKNDKSSFIFLDPPYLFSDNSSYSKQKRKDGEDMTDMIIDILKIMKDKKTKCKILLIINDMKMLRTLYGNLVKGSYEKLYQLGKRKNNHLIIANYTIN